MARLLGLRVRSEIVGGLVSAAVAIPLAMGFGMFAFVPLGDKYFANGAQAGLYSAFLVALTTVLLGDKTTTVYAPRINSTFFLGAFLYGLVHSQAPALQSHSVELILLVFFGVILLGGFFQALLGLVKIGTLLKFTPHPVMAGFQTTAAALLFLVQLADVSGYEQIKPFTFVLSHPEGVKPCSVLIAALTFATMWNSRKFIPKIPSLLVGLTVGTIAYYALVALGLREALGPTIGDASKDAFSHSPWAHLSNLSSDGSLVVLLPTMLAGGLALAIIASIDALLCAKLVCQPGDPRTDADQLLTRLGISNLVAASFGGITSGINIGPSLINRAFGGRTPISVLVNALAILLAVTLFFPIITLLPRVALSAVIMVIAIQHFDPWSIQLVRRIAAGSGSQRQFLIVDFLVVALVAVLSITVNIVLAVLLGTVIAIMLFVVRMSRSIVRRQYRCGTVSSRKSRHENEVQAIERHGNTILIMELQGALFFGTGERLIDEILKATKQKTGAVILDLRRISYIDTTGARMLLDIRAELSGTAVSSGFVLPSRSDIALRLKNFGVLERIPGDQTFEDTDRAIEWAEEDLLHKILGDRFSATQEMPLERVGILHNFDLDEISVLKSRLTRVAHAKGAAIFQQGETGNELFLII